MLAQNFNRSTNVAMEHNLLLPIYYFANPAGGLPDMKQQTAVEWLWNLSQTKELEASDFEQALAMEHDQHGQTWDAAIHAHDARGHVYARSICDFDDYYKETYNHHTI
jgi:hypothetical protein